jgi:uncharacterized protein
MRFSPPKITSFLLKVASRCNLDCDYCYVFNHVDQGWKKMPPLMSYDVREKFAQRLAEYVSDNDLKDILIVYHGGEPLLLGSEKIVETSTLIRKLLPEDVRVDFSLQTNGVLLKELDLKRFELANVGVSLSLDGPQEANDLHRVTHKKRSSYFETLRAYNLLKQYPKIFTGVIAVIDVRTSPFKLFEFFNQLNPPKLDFLLPDANYVNRPPFREDNPDIYVDWLTKAFDLWFDRYPHLQVRLFDTLVQTIAGSPSGTDFFGFGDVSLLSVETDGGYHDLDVLKITEEGKSALNLNVFEHKIEDAASSEKIKFHRKLLSLTGVSGQCQMCPVVEICGGGAVPHRFDGKSFENPTIYCKEMLSLIDHVMNRLSDSFELVDDTEEEQATDSSIVSELEHFDEIEYNVAQAGNLSFDIVQSRWLKQSSVSFNQALREVKNRYPEFNSVVDSLINLDESAFQRISVFPSVQLWTNVILNSQKGLTLQDLDECSIEPEYGYINYVHQNYVSLDSDKIFIHPGDFWLRKPYGSKIVFEEDFSVVEKGTRLIQQALKIIDEFNPALLDEIKKISPVILFIQDPMAHPEKFVSFSDNVVPGALYVCIRHSLGFADPYDLADSIIHEHRHQKLYLLENFQKVIVSDVPYVSSPWREEPRPVSGLFHAVFVFYELQKFWYFVYQNSDLVTSQKALREYQKDLEMLAEGISTLYNCRFTKIGSNLLNRINQDISINRERLLNEAHDLYQSNVCSSKL